jgi:hypothetical protein
VHRISLRGLCTGVTVPRRGFPSSDKTENSWGWLCIPNNGIGKLLVLLRAIHVHWGEPGLSFRINISVRITIKPCMSMVILIVKIWTAFAWLGN